MDRSDRPRVTLAVRRLAHGDGIEAPSLASAGSAGLDVRAAVSQAVVVAPGERRRIPTGFSFELPEGWEAQVRPRSGLASEGLTLTNSPGTIDSDYRGEVMVLVVNLGDAPIEIRRGDRIAQLVLAPVPRVTVVELDSLSETERGGGGFGSTGRN